MNESTDQRRCASWHGRKEHEEVPAKLMDGEQVLPAARSLARHGRVDLGIIAVSATGAGCASNKQMPVGRKE